MCRQGHVCLHGNASWLPGPLHSVSHLAISLSVSFFESLSLFLSPSLQNPSPQFFCLSISFYLSPLGLSLFLSPSSTRSQSLSILHSLFFPSLDLSLLLSLDLSFSVSQPLCFSASLSLSTPRTAKDLRDLMPGQPKQQQQLYFTRGRSMELTLKC